MKLKFWKKEKEEPKKLTKEERQSKIIADGLEMFAARMAGELIKIFLIVILIVVLFFVGLYGYGTYQEHQFEKEHCGGEPCFIGITEMAMVDKCTLDRVRCVIYLKDSEKPDYVTEIKSCGFAEANAWFELKKQFYLPEEIEMECFP